MKQKLLLLILLVLASTKLLAYDFEIGGIYYSFYNKQDKTLSVSKPAAGIQYKGDIVIPSTISHEGETYTVVSISWEAFKACSQLESLDIGSSVRYIEYNFSGCNNLMKIKATGNENFYVENKCLYSQKGSLILAERDITEISIPHTVKSIESNAFEFCKDLKTVVFHDAVTSIGRYAFHGCSNLSEVVIPKLVQSIADETFDGCTNLSQIELGYSISRINGTAFHDCTSLRTITILNNRPPIIDENSWRLYPLNFIVKVPCHSVEIYKNSGWIWQDCQVVGIGDGVDYYEGEKFFFENEGKKLDYIVTSLAEKTCSLAPHCGQRYDLTNAVIPAEADGYQVTKFEDLAFESSSSLESVIIPKTVTLMGNQVFNSNFNKLQEIISLNPTPPEATVKTFDNLPYYAKSKIIIKVPAKSVELYKSAEGWNIFNNIIALSDQEMQTLAVESPQKESFFTAPAYNLDGQRVGDGYKGIVIRNGKKTVRK